MNAGPSVDAQNRGDIVIVQKLVYLWRKLVAVRRKGELESLAGARFKFAPVSSNLDHSIHVHQRFAAKVIDIQVPHMTADVKKQV